MQINLKLDKSAPPSYRQRMRVLMPVGLITAVLPTILMPPLVYASGKAVMAFFLTLPWLLVGVLGTILRARSNARYHITSLEADATLLKISYIDGDVLRQEEGLLATFRVMIVIKQKYGAVPAGLYMGRNKGLDFQIYQPLKYGWTKEDMILLKERFPERIPR